MIARPNRPAAMLLGGLSLEQYAGVTAALAEQFDLSEILEQEGIDPSAWPAASRAWSRAIVEATNLQIVLIEKRRIAEDCLARSLSPLDEDPAAWIGLLGALATSGTSSSLIDSLGITMSDIGRLGRHWKRKMEADPSLAKQLEDLAPTASPPSHVQAGPLELRPFPWSPPGRKKQDVPERPAVTTAPNAHNEVAAPRRQHLASFQLRDQRVPVPQQVAHALGPVVDEQAPAVVAQVTAWAQSATSTEPALPFEALEPGALGVSLVKYAQLLTLIQQPRADVAAILAAWGLDDHKRRAIEEHYTKKFSREARWATEFVKLLAQAQKAMAESKAVAPIPRSLSATVGLPPPSPSSTATAAPELSIEQYAWVVATLRKTPADRLNEVLGRLRLTPETRATLDARWGARMAAEPGLSVALGAAVKRHLLAPLPNQAADPVVPRGPFVAPVIVEARASSSPGKTPAALVSTALTDPAVDRAIAAGHLPALPFEDSEEAPPSRKPSDRSQNHSPAVSTGTAMAGGLRRASPGTLPFAKDGRSQSGRNQPNWTVERFGELCIDMYVSGKPEADVLASVGLTREQYAGLDAYWNAEMQRDPSLRERWTAASARRRDQLETSRDRKL